MITFRTIVTGDLKDYIHSSDFKSMDHIPISSKRALAHFHNPVADKDDPVLFLAYRENRLAGYLGALVDRFYFDDRKKKVAWLSCMWVHPEYRRLGIAVQLLNLAYDAWNGRLLITNFIPRSKAAFDKTGKYEDFHSLKGIRGYLRFDLDSILVNKKPVLRSIRWLLTGGNAVLNLVNEARLLFYQFDLTDIHTENIDSIDRETEIFINQHNQGHLTAKTASEFNWMMKYPWIGSDYEQKNEAKKYTFSVYDKNFRQWFLKVYYQKKMIAFLMLTVRGHHLKTPFLYVEKDYHEQVKNVIYNFSNDKNIRTVTTFHTGLADAIANSCHPFLMLRDYTQDSIITKKLSGELGDSGKYYIMDGDGDCAFT